jgi:hypothetical protein
MNRFIFIFGLIILVFFVLIWIHGTSLSLAGIPKMINYQGMLTGTDGTTPVTNGNYPILFSIYNTSSEGSSLWSHTYNVSVTNGLFNVILGDSGAPINLPFDTTYWLGIKVGDDPELSPRIKLTSVGYAYRAKVADSAVVAGSGGGGGGWVDEGAVVRLESGTDSVGIGTTTPAAKFDVRGTVNVGENGTGYDVNFYGADYSSRMFWDESKMALRAGGAGSQWDDDSVGQYSFATGFYTQAKGNYSVATGNATDANGDFSMAVGQLSTASGTFSTAIGQDATAAGLFSTAIGRYVTADSDYTIVLGSGLNAPNPLVNDKPSSFMVGFDDTIPTLFVNGSSVGIGTNNPLRELHIAGAGYTEIMLEKTDATTNKGNV